MKNKLVFLAAIILISAGLSSCGKKHSPVAPVDDATITFTATTTGTATQVSTTTQSATATATQSGTVTNTATDSATASSTGTSTWTATYTPTNTLTVTAIDTATKTHTSTVTDTATDTKTYTPTNSVTRTNTQTFTPTDTVTDTATDTKTYTPTNTITSTHTQTFTPTDTPTNTSTNTPSNTPTITQTPTVTDTVTDTRTYTPTFTNTSTHTETFTRTFTETHTVTDTPTDTATNTITNTPTITFTPTDSLTPTETETATETRTATITNTPTNTPNATLTAVVLHSFASVPGGTFVQTDGTSSFTHTISSFEMAKYEVTYELWYSVRQWALSNGYVFQNPGREGNDGTDGAAPTAAQYEPVTMISWRDAVIWCNAYNQMTGLAPLYYSNAGFITPVKDSTDATNGSDINWSAGSVDNPYVNWSANGYRLPTEGEWEYAARYIDGSSWLPYNYASGAAADYNNAAATGLVAWFSPNSGNVTHQDGGKNANALGIYDMSGNVWELCWDGYGSYPGTSTDYRGTYAYYRMMRGGCYFNSATGMLTGYRDHIAVYVELNAMGLRLAKSQNTPTFTPTQTQTPTDTATPTPTGTITNTPNATQTAVILHSFAPVTGGTFVQTDGTSSFTHTITSFYMAKYEVTYELWYSVMQWAVANGYTFQNAGREGNDGTDGAAPTAAKYEPVTMITTRDAIVWCNAYSEMTGRSLTYFSDAGFTAPLKDSSDGAYGATVNWSAGSFDYPYVNWSANGYRVPTEGEWEYAARYIDGSSWLPYNYASGATADYTNSAATSLVAWYNSNAGGVTHDVGLKAANALGIYDMSGNAMERCFDGYGSYPGTSTDYRGCQVCSVYHMARGGAMTSTQNISTGYRDHLAQWLEYDFTGFRLARSQ